MSVSRGHRKGMNFNEVSNWTGMCQWGHFFPPWIHYKTSGCGVCICRTRVFPQLQCVALPWPLSIFAVVQSLVKRVCSPELLSCGQVPPLKWNPYTSCLCRLRSFGGCAPILKGRSCWKGMMGCWGTTSAPPSHSVTARFVRRSSDSRVSLPSQKNNGT